MSEELVKPRPLPLVPEYHAHVCMLLDAVDPVDEDGHLRAKLEGMGLKKRGGGKWIYIVYKGDSIFGAAFWPVYARDEDGRLCHVEPKGNYEVHPWPST